MSTRCPTCGAPLLVRPDSTTWRPHYTWCRWAPRQRAPVVRLLPGHVPDYDYDDEGDTDACH